MSSSATELRGAVDGVQPPTGGLASVVGRLTSVHAVAVVAATISGPILARALGVEGRGELAAILAVLTTAPCLLDLGLNQWVARERALGRTRADVLGAALPLALACSLIGVVTAYPLSRALGAGRDVVTVFLQVGLLLMPVSVVLWTLLGLVIGESRWRLLVMIRIVGTIAPVVAILALLAIDKLTVTGAALAFLGGGLVGSLLALRTASGMRRLSFSWGRTRAAGTFGVKSWLTAIASTANIRLDLVLMAALVSSRELGLYAVAVGVAAVTTGISQAVSSALFPRVAQGDAELVGRAGRVNVLVIGIGAGTLAIISIPGIPAVFGSEFEDAVAMTVILLAASIPVAAAVVLSSALNAAGNPGAAMRAELVGLAVTVPALIVFLPAHGGVAAALISLSSYSVRVAMQVRSAQRTFDERWWMFIVPTSDDLRFVSEWLLGVVRQSLRRARSHP